MSAYKVRSPVSPFDTVAGLVAVAKEESTALHLDESGQVTADAVPEWKSVMPLDKDCVLISFGGGEEKVSSVGSSAGRRISFKRSDVAAPLEPSSST